MNNNISFVNPPFFDVHRPCISLGILRAVLRDAGLSVAVHYANLWYANAVGIETYQVISQGAAPHDALGDWLFGKAAFPEFRPDNEEYLDRVLQLRPELAVTEQGQKGNLLALRERGRAFIEQAVDRILEHEPRIVGCTSTFCQHVASLAILRVVKERDPRIVTMLGGANVESIMGQTTHRNFPWVDYVVSGEAEDLIVPLCRGALECGADLPVNRVPYGVFAPIHRSTAYPSINRGDGVPRASVLDLNAVPTPEYDEFFAEIERSPYKARVIPNVLIETSRGCWWGQVSHCTFCGLNGNGMTFRSKTPARVLGEMDELVAKHGVRRIEAVDNILDMKYFQSLLPEIVRSGRKYMLFYETKSNLTKTQVELLAQAGIRTIQPGIENLDTHVLELMKKGVSAWQNVRLLKWARQYGVAVQWSTIYGFPGEQDSWYADAAKLVPKLFHLQPGGTHPIRFDRFSPYHMNPEASGLKLVPYEFYRYAFPLNEAELANQAYFFVDAGKPRLEVDADALQSRPGLVEYLKVVRQWIAEFERVPRPVCVLFEREGKTFLNDTRSAYRKGLRQIASLEAKVLALADEGIASSKLIPQVMETAGCSSDLAERTVREMDESGLLAFIDKRALSLPLRVPVRRLPQWYQVPIGGVANLPQPVAQQEAVPVTA